MPRMMKGNVNPNSLQVVLTLLAKVIIVKSVGK